MPQGAVEDSRTTILQIKESSSWVLSGKERNLSKPLSSWETMGSPRPYSLRTNMRGVHWEGYSGAWIARRDFINDPASQ